MEKGAKWSVFVIVLLGGIFLASLALFGWWFTVDQGERAVVLRAGAITKVVGPGFHIKTPWLDAVEKISVQDNTYHDDLPTYSSDQQPAVLRTSISFKINPDQVDDVYSRYGGMDNMVERTIWPRAVQAVKTEFGQFQAATAISHRAELNKQAMARVQQALVGEPITVTGVQIENIDYSDAYEQVVEQRMQAEVEVGKKQQMLLQEKINADIARTQAQGRADSVQAEAIAKAEATRIQGEAEAKAIKARAEALAANAALVELTRAERWDGKLPTTMLPNGTVPFLTQSDGVVR